MADSKFVRYVGDSRYALTLLGSLRDRTVRQVVCHRSVPAPLGSFRFPKEPKTRVILSCGEAASRRILCVSTHRNARITQLHSVLPVGAITDRPQTFQILSTCRWMGFCESRAVNNRPYGCTAGFPVPTNDVFGRRNASPTVYTERGAVSFILRQLLVLLESVSSSRRFWQTSRHCGTYLPPCTLPPSPAGSWPSRHRPRKQAGRPPGEGRSHRAGPYHWPC